MVELERTITAEAETAEGWSKTAVGGPSEADHASPLREGVRFGRYVVIGRLGEGGMGVVYTAYDPELDRRVALKLLAGTGRSDAARVRMLREAQAMARLQHPNVVTVYDVGTADDEVYVAMEQVHGVTLRRWLELARRPWPLVLEVMQGVAKGLIAAHSAGLVHRDVKPENVMIGDDGRVLVMDFGLARAQGPTTEMELAGALTATSSLLSSELTRVGAVLGTPFYMAPEGIRGAVIDARADQFSWCVTCWEALYGERPFVGEDLAELQRNILSGKLRGPPAGSKVPGGVRRALLRGLDIDPDRRHASMAALLTALAATMRRRRWRVAGYVAGALSLAVAAGFGWQRVEAAAASERCVAAGAAIASTWDAGQAERLAAAFVATGRPEAAEVWARTQPWLDRYAAAWASARSELCAGSLGRAPTAQDELAGECLEDRRAGLEALVEVFARADESTLRRAVTVTSRLPAIATCGDPEWLARAPRSPREPAAKAEAARVRTGLARVAMLVHAARYEEAMREVELVTPAAEALGFAPLRLALQLERGELEGHRGAYTEAEASLEAVVWAAEAEGLDELVVDAATGLIYTVGLSLGRPEEGARWGRFALAVRRRIGTDETLGASDTYAALGIVTEARGEFEEAQRLKEKVLDLRLRHLGPDHPSVGNAQDMLGVVLMNRGDLQGARAAHERGLVIRLATLGPMHLEVGNSYTNLGNVHTLLRQTAVALEMQEKARAIFAAVLGPEHPTTAVALENGAVCRFQLGEYAAALADHREALAIREKALGAVHPHVAASQFGIGDVLRQQGDLEGAEAAFTRALTISEAQGASHPMVAVALLKQAEVWRARGELGRALVALERAAEIRGARELPGISGAAIDFRLGQVLWERGERERGRTLITGATPTLLADDPTASDPDTRAIQAWLAEHAAELGS